MRTIPFAVLGTGMAGLGAGHVLMSANAPFVCYDKNGYIGGHTRSLRYPTGFVFDEGGHISFTKNEHVQQVLANNVSGAFEERKLTIDNYWRGRRIPHPVQSNLRHLPQDLIVQIITDFRRKGGHSPGVAALADGVDAAPTTYADWLRDAYGEAFAKTFPMVYGKKYHTTSMENLTTDWIGPRMYRPSLEELIAGAIAGTSPTTHYVDKYRYPSSGGFVSYLEPFSSQFDIQLERRVVRIEPRNKVIQFADGEAITYGALISSIPLPDIVRLIENAPEDVLAASRTLAFTSAVLINLGVSRADISDSAITYFYDEDVIFSRINLPHLFSENNAPRGCGCIQAEIYFSDKYKPRTESLPALIERAVSDLRRCGFLREKDAILMTDAVVNQYANVIYDSDRAAAVQAVHRFLNEINVLYCGRYGDWDHAWTDQAFLSGEKAARTALGS